MFQSLRALLSLLLLAGLLFLQPPRAMAEDESARSSFADITVDRSTPEANLRTFLIAADRTILRLDAREWARNFYSAWLYPEITEEQAAEIDLLKRYMLDSLDLSGFPDWRRESAGIETAFMLRAILKAENVTKDTQFRKVRDGLWVIPGTYIQAASVTSGMRTGDVIFSADTVANIPSLYDTMHASAQEGGFDPYRYYTETPGGLTPPRWGGIAHKLPPFLQWSFGSNTLFQWLLTLGVIGFVLGVPLALGSMIRNGGIRWFAQAVVIGLLSNTASGIVINEAGLSGSSATVVTILFVALYFGSLVICTLVIGEWVGTWLSTYQRNKDSSFDTSIIRLATRIVSVMAALSITVYGISTAGVPVFGIIAGFGVGGLAVALAAKPTLENILAGVILFLDDSIKVGDVIEADPLSGTIEDIGMRSTRIRSADGGLISVTNAELADKVIKNVSRRVTNQKGQGPKAVDASMRQSA